MGKLCIYLPSFACDYTGVCSSFYDLDCLTVVHDASCCTASYVFSDEERWEDHRTLVLSTQLRNVEAILGSDDALLERIVPAWQQVRTGMIALVGTPVPAVTGMDMQGLADRVEGRCGVPCFGFDTTGFAYYDRGIYLASRALLERYALEPSDPLPGTVNLLGATPLDFGAGQNVSDFRAMMEEMGLTVNAVMPMQADIPSIQRVPAASRNIALSSAGLLTARWLQRRYGTPYTALVPFTRRQCRMALEGERVPSGDRKEPILFIGDQVTGISLRMAWYLSDIGHRIDVASFFGWDKSLAAPEDVSLASERQLIELLRERAYDTVIADPVFFGLPHMEKVQCIPFVHPAASGKLHWGEIPRFCSYGSPF